MSTINPKESTGQKEKQMETPLNVSLRQWYAGQALKIIPHIARDVYQNQETWSSNCYASEAFKIADAMIKQGEKE